MLDMTVGDIRNHIIKFSIPIFVANVLQLMNTIVDRIWAGKFISANALAAISISNSIFFIMLSISIGLGLAASIMISQFFGAKVNDKLKTVIGNSFILVIIVSIISTLSVQIFIDPIIGWIQTPPEIVQYTKDYLLVLSIGFIFVMAYNLVTSFFRAIGNSMIPLNFLIVSVVINAILDPILMLGLGPFPRMELKGAALATIIAQFIAFVAGFIYMQRKAPALAVQTIHFHPHREIIIKMFNLAFPSMIRFGLLSVGLTVIQAFINKFGADASAAFGAAANIDSLAFFPAMTISTAVSTIVGQNIGAHKIDRAQKALVEGIKITLFLDFFISLAAFFFPRALLSIFLNENSAVALEIGANYLRIIAVPYLFIMCVIVIIGLIQGAGDTMATLILSIINLWMIRVPLVIFMSNRFGINGIWTAIGAAFIIDFVVTYFYYRLGFWKKKALV
ncbi:MATE family efflux transporter [candidate division KSB1 bacterium]|nr:MATE family efflux transporter [candidate division KSB1 bacterium]